MRMSVGPLPVLPAPLLLEHELERRSDGSPARGAVGYGPDALESPGLAEEAEIDVGEARPVGLRLEQVALRGVAQQGLVAAAGAGLGIDLVEVFGAVVVLAGPVEAL